MRISALQLRKIIKEEVTALLVEGAQPITISELQNLVRGRVPRAVFDVDEEDGQVVIYTGMRVGGDGTTLEDTDTGYR